MVLYRVTLVPLAEELRAVGLGLLSPLYDDDVAFNGSERRITQLLNMLMKRGTDPEYFPKPDKSLFISDTLGREEAAKRELAAE